MHVCMYIMYAYAQIDGVAGLLCGCSLTGEHSIFLFTPRCSAVFMDDWITIEKKQRGSLILLLAVSNLPSFLR